MTSWQKGLGSFFLAVILAVPAFANPNAGNVNPAQPGTLNYIEGQASIGMQPLTQNSVGSVALQAGQTLATQKGKAEILLTPGVFFRINDGSSLVMDSPGLANTALTLQTGRAMAEIGEIHQANDIIVNVNGASVHLLKKGLYDFDANQGVIRVFDGQANVQVNGQNFEVKGGHELAFKTADKLKARGFDKKAYEDDFYRWASLRSSYLAEANVDVARRYSGGSGWYGTGWYWDPWFSAYTWIPGDGIFWSPFGWGYYSPWLAYSAPFGRFGYGGYYRSFGPYYRPSIAANRGFASSGVSPAVRGGFAGGMRAGGGFHGGGGGGGHR